MGRRCLPFTFPSNVFNFARPAYCRRNKSKSLSALRDPGLFLFCAPPLAAASWARKKRRIPDAEKVVSFFSCFLRNSPLASHLVPPESLANPHFSHFLPSHPALSRISQLSCLFTLRKKTYGARKLAPVYSQLTHTDVRAPPREEKIRISHMDQRPVEGSCCRIRVQCIS